MNMENTNNYINNTANDDSLITIIVSNSYIKKFYLDERLNVLPKEVKETVKILFVKLTEEIGGIVEVLFDNNEYDLIFRAYKNDDDLNYDDINANYKLTKLEREYKEIFDQIAKFCKFKINGLV